MPGYLYDANPVNDAKYLLNKDVLYYSLYALMCQRWGQGKTLDEGFSWDNTVWWNHMTALEEYQRPNIAAEKMPEDGLLADTAKNLAVVTAGRRRTRMWSLISSSPPTVFSIGTRSAARARRTRYLPR